MSTRVQSYDIPTLFQRLDARVTDPDTPVNARDRQTLRKNYNILIARRAREPILTMRMHDEATDGSGWSSNPYGYVSENMEATAAVALSVPIYVPPFVKTCQLNVRAYKASGDTNIELYPYIHVAGARLPPNTSDKITVSSTTIAQVTGSVDVDPEVEHDGYGQFTLLAVAVMNSADTGSNTNAVAMGPDWIEFGSTGIGASAGDIIYCVDDATILPRVITLVDTVGSNTRYYVDPPWGARDLYAVSSEVAFNARTAGTLTVENVTLYPNNVTDFDGEVVV